MAQGTYGHHVAVDAAVVCEQERAGIRAYARRKDNIGDVIVRPGLNIVPGRREVAGGCGGRRVESDIEQTDVTVVHVVLVGRGALVGLHEGNPALGITCRQRDGSRPGCAAVG